MTAIATIVAQYVDAPRNGNPKAPWSIKDATGSRWKFWPDKVGRVSPGSTIVVEWKEGDEYQGKRDQLITKIVGESGETGPTQAPRPAASNGHPAALGGASSYAPQGNKDEVIFCCGIVNSAIKAGALHINASALTDAIQEARQAWRNTFGNNQ